MVGHRSARAQCATGSRDSDLEAECGDIGGGYLGAPVPATTEPFSSNLGRARNHSVHFAALRASSSSAYHVGNGFNWSESGQFRTASVLRRHLNLSTWWPRRTMWPRVIRQDYTEAPKLCFIKHAGGTINRANRAAEWGG